jgi:hypothetical protein
MTDGGSRRRCGDQYNFDDIISTMIGEDDAEFDHMIVNDEFQ